MKGKIYIVGLPIGNLKDITLRAIEVLQNVNMIFCEDSREFIKIAKTYEINTKTESFYDFNEREKTTKIINLITQGVDIAVVSDRGMPSISDPGFYLIRELYKSFPLEIKDILVIIPGVSSITTVITACPFEKNFTFLGFFNEKHIDKYKDYSTSLIFFESPNRINKSLKILYELFGKRKIFIAKEMTKTYEEFILGELGTINIVDPKGEFVIVLDAQHKENIVNPVILKRILDLKINISNNDLSKILSVIFDYSKTEIYNLLNEN